jgi:hypothetical protein
MTSVLLLKLGQVAGALLLAAGVASCSMAAEGRTTPLLFIAGAVVYGGCRLAAWLMKRE